MQLKIPTQKGCSCGMEGDIKAGGRKAENTVVNRVKVCNNSLKSNIICQMHLSEDI